MFGILLNRNGANRLLRVIERGSRGNLNRTSSCASGNGDKTGTRYGCDYDSDCDAGWKPGREDIYLHRKSGT